MLPAPFLSLSRLSFVLLILAGLTGCPATATWDQEYVCKGHERSTTRVQSHPETENYEKTYPIAIDFHIRSGLALVKSHQVALLQQDRGTRVFNSSGLASWASGSFNNQSGALTLIESQVLYLDGVAHETRTTGQYACAIARQRLTS